MAKYKELNFTELVDVNEFFEEMEGKTRPIVMQIRFEDYSALDPSEFYVMNPADAEDFLGDVFGSEFEFPEDEGASVHWSFL